MTGQEVDTLPARDSTLILAAWHDDSPPQRPNLINQDDEVPQSTVPKAPSVGQSTQEAAASSQSSDLLSAQQLLQRAASNLFYSTPMRSTARLRMNMFGQKFVAEGSYLQMGQGSGRTKLEFAFGDPDYPSRLLQVCDGRFYYRLASNHEASSLEFVDLLQVAQADQQQLIGSPSSWMTMGGLPGLLQNTASAFEFQPVEQSQLGDIPVFHIRGKWKKEFLTRILGGTVDRAWIENSMQWHQLPEQLPHVVEIYLGNNSFFPLFPYRIEFLRLDKDEDGTNLKRVFTFELYEVNKLAEISDELFKINYEDITPINITNEFIRRIEQLRPAQTANRKQEPTNR